MSLTLKSKVHGNSNAGYGFGFTFCSTKQLLLVMPLLGLVWSLEIVEEWGPMLWQVLSIPNKDLRTVLSSRFWAYSSFHVGRLLTWQVDKIGLSVLLKRRNTSYLFGVHSQRRPLHPMLYKVCPIKVSIYSPPHPY